MIIAESEINRVDNPAYSLAFVEIDYRLGGQMYLSLSEHGITTL